MPAMTSGDGPAASGRAARRLEGRVVALAETRELDRLAELLEAEGARVWRCPMVAILDAPDPGPVEAWLRALVDGHFDDVVFLTGEGLRRMMGVAERRGFAPEVIRALGSVRKITRGPKPARALKELGLSTDLAAAVPTSGGIMDELGRLSLRGRRVGLQLYGEEPSRALVAFIEAEGASVSTVAPYVYASASDAARLGELVEALDGGAVDTIAFTSAAQVDRLFGVAAEAGLLDKLVRALGEACVAAIGPVAAEALGARGVAIDVLPEKAFVMKRLVAAIADSVQRHRPAGA
jgi:uroporphyrinogen-III synthase